MSISGWEWFWAGEHGRDRLLRETLDAEISHSAMRTSALTSRLNHLQGSVEKRLEALTLAFDAYVELGDLRQQLNELPNTRQARLEVARVMEELMATGRAEPIEATGELDLWLTHAINAVVHRITAGEPSADERVAREQSSDAPIFIALVLGGLGQGEAVQDDLAELMITDGSANPSRQALWEGIITGKFGLHALETVETAVRPHLAAVQDWAEWLDRWAPSTRGAGLYDNALHLAQTLDELTEPDPVVAEARGARAREQIREQSAVMASGVTGQERHLRARAEVLRARIENPDAAAEDAGEAERDAHVEFDALIGMAIGDEGLSREVRARLIRWVLISVREAIRAVAPAEIPTDALELRKNYHGVTIRVDEEGPDPAAREAAIAQVRRSERRAPIRPWVAGAVAGVGLFTLIMAIVLTTGALAWIGVLLAVTGGAGYVWLKRIDDEYDDSVEVLLRSLDRKLEDDQAAVVKRAAERREQRLLEQGRQAVLETLAPLGE
ncbi:hypothetical protein [Propioniferax innocua]|uniref:Uncharacterized protein n=1 Tax=Propioniferax innocua TaxID=1753 RepID=A0A542Z7H6_9ACTN|nr:hypothetical protein [Propioniferax innocua]TQL56296.1 hypothetical protein FB460_2601 [Propioniferax innocua]